jgi:hypothetical protein
MNRGADTHLLQSFHKLLSLWNPYHKLMPCMSDSAAQQWNTKTGLLQPFRVSFRKSLPVLLLLFKNVESFMQNGGL